MSHHDKIRFVRHRRLPFAFVKSPCAGVGAEYAQVQAASFVSLDRGKHSCAKGSRAVRSKQHQNAQVIVVRLAGIDLQVTGKLSVHLHHPDLPGRECLVASKPQSSSMWGLNAAS